MADTVSSDLQSYFNMITSSERGEDVRDAIVMAAKNLQKVAGNTNSLNGVDWTKFAPRSDYLAFRELLFGKPATSTEPEVKGLIQFDDYTLLEDDEYAITSENLMNSGNMYAIVANYIRPSLATIMNFQSDPVATNPKAKEAIDIYIAYLNEAKNSIVANLKAKGYQDPVTSKYVSLKPEECEDMWDFVALIDKIGSGTPELTSGSFSERKTYDAGDGRAYSHFTVNCTDYIQSQSFNENITYTADDGKLFAKTINISVNSRGSSARGRTTGSGVDDMTDDGYIKSYTLTENGHFDTMERLGAPGVLEFSTDVTVPDVSGQVFTVTWMNDGSAIGSPTQVEAYGIARYDGPEPENEDPNLVFAGWDPAPVFVTSDLTCNATFKPLSHAAGEEIKDDWIAIFANRGANYNIGDYKTMGIGVIDGYNYGNMVFMKVAEGEDSTTSTWITKSVHNARSGLNANEAAQWPTSPLRMFLNGKFIEDLSHGNNNAQLLAKAATPVRKRTLTNIKDSNIVYAEMESIDTFWVPSAREMIGAIKYDEADAKRFKFIYNGLTADSNQYVYNWIATGLRPNGDRGSVPFMPNSTTGVYLGQYIDNYGQNYSRAFGDPACTLSAVQRYQTDQHGNNVATQVDFVITPSDPELYKSTGGGGFHTRTYGVSYEVNGSTCAWSWSANPQNWNINQFRIGFCM